MTYNRWERLHFKLLGHWPHSVVERRLQELDEKDHKIEQARQQYLRGEIDLDDLNFRTDVALGLKRR